MSLVSCQSCGPTACGNTSSKEKARDVSAVSMLLSFHAHVLHLLMGIPETVSHFMLMFVRFVFAGPIITLESLGGGGTPSKLNKRHWLRLLKQPPVW